MTRISHLDARQTLSTIMSKEKLGNEYGLESVAADMPVGHRPKRITRNRGRRQETLTAPRDLRPSGYVGTFSASVLTVPVGEAEDPGSAMTQTLFCLISSNSLRTAAARHEPLFDSLPPSFSLC